MKLSPSVLQFTESQGKPAVLMTVPTTEFSVLLKLEERDGEVGVVSKLTPAKFDGDDAEELNDGDPLPAELDMLMAQAYLYSEPLAHYLACDEHRSALRTELCLAHERLEKAKKVLPSSTESTLLAASIGMNNNIAPQLVIAMNLHVEHKVYKYEEVELAVVMKAKTSGTDPMLLVADVPLDFPPCVPALTDEERAAYNQLVADVKAGKVPGASLADNHSAATTLH